MGIESAAADVTVEWGDLQGRVAGDVAWFKAVPYPAPPVSPLQWHPAQAVEHWEVVRDRFHLGSDCPQPPFLDIRLVAVDGG